MNRWIWRATGLAAMSGAAACGGDVTVGGGGEGSFWVSYCESRATACGTTPDACLPEETCARDLLRDEVEATLLECLSTSCAQDVCVAQIAAQFPLTAKGAEYDAACKAYLAACPGGNNDACSSTPILADSLLDQLLPCPSAPSCAEAISCFDAVTAETSDVCRDWI